MKKNGRNKAILLDYITTNKSIVDLAKEYGISRQRVHKIIEVESCNQETIDKIDEFVKRMRNV